MEPGTRITPENRAEAEREIQKDAEREREMLVSPEFISRLSDLVCKTNDVAHAAMVIATIALTIELVVVVLALFA